MPFLQYEEPPIVDILILISFFTFLSISEWLSSKIIKAGIIGPIVVGIIYGEPLANILHLEWQETFLDIGYIGLILIIFEGGLTTRLDLLKKNFLLSTFAAATGVIVPISLSYLLLYLGFGYGAVETFIIGAALSTTSLGTTFAVISSASASVDLANTLIGTILVSAAVIDDVTGLVMSSVIRGLGSLTGGGNVSLGWLIGRPIVASAAMAILTPLLTKYAIAPFFRRYVEKRFARYDHLSNIILIVLVLCAFLTIAAYAGTSVLFGAFIAGTFLTYLPSKQPDGPFQVLSREHGEQNADKSPTFVHTFEKYLFDIQKYLLAPLFFASIGFAIPFLSLWTGSAIWRGVIYTLLMLVAKFVVGGWVPLWDLKSARQAKSKAKSDSKATSNDLDLEASETPSQATDKASSSSSIPAALLLGGAMVARGEIGLLIVQIGYNETDYVSEAGFITAVWAILLNTIIGPMAVGYLVKKKGKQIGSGPWGLEKGASKSGSASSSNETASGNEKEDADSS